MEMKDRALDYWLTNKHSLGSPYCRVWLSEKNKLCGMFDRWDLPLADSCSHSAREGPQVRASLRIETAQTLHTANVVLQQTHICHCGLLRFLKNRCGAVDVVAT